METEPERRENLWANTRKMMHGLQELGFDTGKSETPVIPIVVGEMFTALGMWRSLLDHGVYVNVVIPPAVPPGREMLRTSYMATHTDNQLDRALEIFETVAKEYGLI
jgi:7-keto-8-aminopelargonate synthetase-like enzyme